MKRPLPVVRPGTNRLQFPTIMDRELARAHGSAYVQLCAFAIDLDRIYVLAPDAEHLAFGWEVFMTECYALVRIDPGLLEHHALLEDTCLTILEQPPDDQGFGSQLLFAVYDAVGRGRYPQSLQPAFQTWRGHPKQLRKALDTLWSDPARELADHAAYCLSAPIAEQLTPPLTPTSRDALERMRARQWLEPD